MPTDDPRKDPYNRDDDIPFHLPKEEPELSDEELRAQDRPETGWASLSQAVTEVYDTEETEDLEVVDGKPIPPLINLEDVAADDDVPFQLPTSEDEGSAREGRMINKMMTMPHQKSPDVPSHQQQTLAGSDGLDPNPDFTNPRRSEPTVQTPRVQGVPPGSAPTVHQDDRFKPSYQPTQPHPTYRNPSAYNAAPGAPSSMANAPAPYAAAPGMPGAAGSPALPHRRPGENRRFRVGCLAIFLGLFVTFCGGLACVTSIAGIVAYARIGDLLDENIARVDQHDTFQSTFLYDRNGQQLYEVFNEGRRTNIHLSDMPQDLINATIAIEDDTFYQNIGVDIPATTVALMGYVGLNQSTAGGSTITQQLVRNVLFDPAKRAERSASRKAEEILLAIALTGRKSKDEILELYLNEIYYGNLAYGAEAASQVFFGKSAIDLTLGEAALLAGLPQAPAELNPLNPDPIVQQQVENRWREVLDQMVDERFISREQRDDAIRQGLSFSNADIQFRAPHFTVWVQGQLENLMTSIGYAPEDIALGGLRVYTTLDLRINDMVQAEVLNQISKLQAQNVGNGAVVVLKPITGEVLAMVGSKDYNDDSIDGRVNVTTARRQPGSTMKAFNYAAALERGMTPGDIIWDTQTRIGIPGQAPYEPVNYDRTFHGPMAMRYALANSYNIPAVQVMRHNVGVDYLLDFSARFGVESLGTDASLYGLSLTLGGGEITLLELTRGYSVFATGGQLVQTQSILCVLDNDNNILYQYEDSCPQGNQTENSFNQTRVISQVLDPRISFLISDVLSDNAARTPVMGASSDLYTPGIISAVKTGTTNDVKDNWTVGYTRNVTVGVWVGNSRGEPMVNSSGLTGAAPIWNRVLTQIYANGDLMTEFAHHDQLLNDQFEIPQGMSQRQICDIRALTDPSPQCPRQRTEWFLDSPAGLPAGDGTLAYPGGGFPQPPANPDEYVVPADPGIYRAVVVPIPDPVASAIQFQVTPGNPVPPPPKYCRVRVDQIQNAAGAQELLFLAPPPDPMDAVYAEQHARRAGLAFLPTIQCTPELVSGVGFGSNYGPIVATAMISSPQPGQIIPEGGMPIIGTVRFDRNQAQYFKLEIRGGLFPNWTTIGDIHYDNEINEGQLEFLPGPPGLQPGNYELQLVIISNDASVLQQPYIVPFTVQ